MVFDKDKAKQFIDVLCVDYKLSFLACQNLLILDEDFFLDMVSFLI